MSGTNANTRLGIQITLQNNQAISGLTQIQQAVARLSSSFRAFETELRAVDRILTYMAVGSVLALVGGFVKMASEMERLTVLLSTLEGSFSKANQRMDQLVSIASRAPFSLQAITDAFVRLKTAGIEPITGANGGGPLQAIIDGLAAMGGSEQQLNRVAVALQQMSGKGVVSLEELRQQLGDSIPNALSLMAEGLGMTTSRLISEISKGNIEAERGINALIRIMQERYGGAATLLSMTMAGAFRQLSTEFNRIAIELQRAGFLDVITVGLRGATQAVSRFNDALRDSGSGILQSFFDWINSNADAIARFLSVMNGFALGIGAMLSGIFSALSELPSEVLAGGLIGYILFGKTGALVGAIMGSVEGMFAGVGAAIGGLIAMVGSLASALGFEMSQFMALGLIGAILFGRAGLVAGMLFNAVDAMIGGARRRLAEFFAWAVGIGAQINEFFSSWSRSSAVEAGNNARDEFMRNNASAPNQTFGDTSTTPFGELFRSGGEAARVNAEQVRNFNQRVQESIEALRRARAEYDGRFGGTANPPSGLTTQEGEQVERITRAYEAMGDRLRSLQGREIDGFLASRQRQLEQLERIIGQVSARADEAESSGRVQQAQQLRAESASLRAQADSFKAVMDQIRAADGARAGERAGLVLNRYANQLNQIREQLEAAQSEFTGGRRSEDAEVERIEARFAATARQLANLQAQVQATRGAEGERIGTLTEIARLQGLLNTVTEQGIEIARRKAAREREDAQLDASRRLQDMQTGLAREQLNRGDGFFGNAFGGNERDLDRLNRQEQYRNVIRQIDDQLRDLQRRMEDRGANVEPWVAQQIQGLEALRQQYQTFYEQVGSFQETAAMAARDLWKSVGETIKDSVGRGLEMLVTRTGSLKDVLEDMYRSITRAAINYLTTLAFNQLGGSLGGMFGGGGGGGSFDLFKFVGSIFGGATGGGMKMAAGGAFNHGIRQFASGASFRNGVVSGPTLFNIGEMGEAGPEAIMPLTRVGGKLGVEARGGGPTVNNISIQAVDAASVRELFYREGGALVEALGQRARLNRGLR
jgi:tape measure domain-containing protein